MRSLRSYLCSDENGSSTNTLHAIDQCNTMIHVANGPKDSEAAPSMLPLSSAAQLDAVLAPQSTDTITTSPQQFLVGSNDSTPSSSFSAAAPSRAGGEAIDDVTSSFFLIRMAQMAHVAPGALQESTYDLFAESDMTRRQPQYQHQHGSTQNKGQPAVQMHNNHQAHPVKHIRETRRMQIVAPPLPSFHPILASPTVLTSQQAQPSFCPRAPTAEFHRSSSVGWGEESMSIGGSPRSNSRQVRCSSSTCHYSSGEDSASVRRRRGPSQERSSLVSGMEGSTILRTHNNKKLSLDTVTEYPTEDDGPLKVPVPPIALSSSGRSPHARCGTVNEARSPQSRRTPSVSMSDPLAWSMQRPRAPSNSTPFDGSLLSPTSALFSPPGTPRNGAFARRSGTGDGSVVCFPPSQASSTTRRLVTVVEDISALVV